MIKAPRTPLKLHITGVQSLASPKNLENWKVVKKRLSCYDFVSKR